jgi:hypothetical protein
MVLIVLFLGLSQFAAAEQIDLTPAQLRKLATHVIVGSIVSVRQSKEERDGWRYTWFVAQVKISQVEKGTGLRQGDVCDVRYWIRSWQGKGVPLTTYGHRGLPNVGGRLRIYLARNSYHGFSRQNHDRGFNVIGPNGFQKLAGASPRGASPRSAAGLRSVPLRAMPSHEHHKRRQLPK